VWLIVGAVVLGILAGLAFGGSLRTLSETHFRWWPLALVGLALQVIPVPSSPGRLDDGLAVALLVLSYVSLLSFLAFNIRKDGFALVAIGIALNALVIAINGGMPVSDPALRIAYGPDYPEIRRALIEDGPPKHHLARPDEDVLLPLSDVIAIGRPVNNVFSVGDMISMAGIVWVLAAATRGGHGKHRVGSRPRRRDVDRNDGEAAMGDSPPWGTSPGTHRSPIGPSAQPRSDSNP
jgi:hypothetical protein